MDAASETLHEPTANMQAKYRDFRNPDLGMKVSILSIF